MITNILPPLLWFMLCDVQLWSTE